MTDITNAIYHDADKAREHLEAIHWPHGPVCPRCGGLDRITKLAGKSTRAGVYKCNECAKPFTVTVGTIFEDSKIPLNKWLLAYRLLNGGKKGFSAHELHRALGITYKSAWFLAHRIRETMDGGDDTPLGGPDKIVESDEAFVGGKKRNRLSGNVAPKKKVVTLVERGGRARSFHVANIHATTVRSALLENVHRASTLMTDEANIYRSVGKLFAGHGHTLHAARVFAKGEIHSNSAENFFSILKRGIIGTYHHVSEAHMHRYLSEFDFRYSTRTLTDAERTAEAVKAARGKRLMYNQPSSLAA